ncbi:hypothetical protein DFS34DRAFT_589500 [Phlyctochytrium arcticum]|nr:hypothetical protein DFS34DRAFT_589500 [Phlyctochytrium arcticum]
MVTSTIPKTHPISASPSAISVNVAVYTSYAGCCPSHYPMATSTKQEKHPMPASSAAANVAVPTLCPGCCPPHRPMAISTKHKRKTHHMPASRAVVHVAVHTLCPPIGQYQLSLKPPTTSATSPSTMIVATSPHLCNVGESICQPLSSQARKFNTTRYQLLATPTEYPPPPSGSSVTTMTRKPPSYGLAMPLSPAPSQRAASLYILLFIHQLVHMPLHHTPRPIPIPLNATTTTVSTSALASALSGTAELLYIFVLIHQLVHTPLAGRHIPQPVPTTTISTTSAVPTPSPNSAPLSPSPLLPPTPGLVPGSSVGRKRVYLSPPLTPHTRAGPGQIVWGGQGFPM